MVVRIKASEVLKDWIDAPHSTPARTRFHKFVWFIIETRNWRSRY